MALAFKVDENLPFEVSEELRQAGHDVVSVQDQGLTGVADPDLAAVCRRAGRALVTLDLDFANVLTYPPDPSPGIVVFRGHRQDLPYVLGLLRRILPLLATETLQNHLWIVEEMRVRIRP